MCSGSPAGDVPLEGRRHFFFVAARAMRDILVEQARRKAGPTRGGDRRRVELREPVAESVPEDALAVHEALAELEKEDPLKAQIVNLRTPGAVAALLLPDPPPARPGGWPSRCRPACP